MAEREGKALLSMEFVGNQTLQPQCTKSGARCTRDSRLYVRGIVATVTPDDREHRDVCAGPLRPSVIESRALP